MIAVNESSVVILGGQSDTIDRVYLFDKIRGSFNELPPLKQGRSGLQAGIVTYPDNTKTIIVTGGYYDSNESDTTEVLNLDSTDEWVDGPMLPKALQNGASVQFKGTLLVVGGYGDDNQASDVIYEFDVMNNNWIEKEEKLMNGRYHAAAFLIPDEVAKCT